MTALHSSASVGSRRLASTSMGGVLVEAASAAQHQDPLRLHNSHGGSMSARSCKSNPGSLPAGSAGSALPPAGSGGRQHMASAFASPHAQLVHKLSGSPEQGTAHDTRAAASRGSGSGSSGSNRLRECPQAQLPQLAEQQTVEGGASSFSQPFSQAEGGLETERQQQQEGFTPGLADRAGGAAPQHGKQPSLFKLMKTRFTALTSFKGTPK